MTTDAARADLLESLDHIVKSHDHDAYFPCMFGHAAEVVAEAAALLREDAETIINLKVMLKATTDASVHFQRRADAAEVKCREAEAQIVGLAPAVPIDRLRVAFKGTSPAAAFRKGGT